MPAVTALPASRVPRLLAAAGGLVAQFVFIAAGVYLGMRADDYKEERAHRASARAALANFRSEMVANRAQVVQRLKYHDGLLDSMRVSQQRGDPAPRTVPEVLRRLGWRGLQPVTYGHVAWDLALATQSLALLPPDLAFSVAKVYTFQTRIEELQSIAMTQLFSPTALEETRWQPFLRALGSHLEDMHYSEPSMIAAYDALVPRLDSALAATR